MKKFVAVFLVVFAAAAFAQEKDDLNTVREYKNKVFEIRNRDPREIAVSLKLLGSGFKGSGMNVNSEMRTITVRDFPENIATIEEAISRLDRAPAARPDITLKISVLIGSKTPLAGATVPEELGSVVKQLQSTLRYSHYGLMSTNVQHTKPGEVAPVEGSGVAESGLLGMTTRPDQPVIYTYRLRNLTLAEAAERASVEIGNFAFSMRVPINTGSGVQYQPVGFETPVSIRQNEKVVIGTTTMADKALIVVVNATVEK